MCTTSSTEPFGPFLSINKTINNPYIAYQCMYVRVRILVCVSVYVSVLPPRRLFPCCIHQFVSVDVLLYCNPNQCCISLRIIALLTTESRNPASQAKSLLGTADARTKSQTLPVVNARQTAYPPPVPKIEKK